MEPNWKYTTIHYEVIDAFEISVSDYQVFDYILRKSAYPHTSDGWCSKSASVIAADLRLSKPTVERSLKTGKEKGLVEVDPNLSQRKRVTRLFADAVDGTIKMMAVPSPQNHQNDGGSTIKMMEDHHQNDGHYNKYNNNLNNKSISPEGSNLNLFQNQNEKQTPNPLPPAPAPAANAEPQADNQVVEFSEFWQAYGKKTGKVASEKLWNKLKPDERRKALDYIPAYHAQQSDPKYRKDPERYIKNKLWEDGVPMGTSLRTESPFMANVPSTPTTPEERVRQRAFSTEITDRQY